MDEQNNRATLDHIRKTFSALLKTLRIPPTILAAVSVALLLGDETVHLIGYEFPRSFATIGSILLLAAIYVSTFRIAGTLLHLIQSLPMAAQKDRKSIASEIRYDTSILNPFAYSEGNLEDYIGPVIIHAPTVVVLMVSVIMMGMTISATGDFLTAMEIIKAPELYNSDQVTAANAAGTEFLKTTGLVLVYHISVGAFGIMYVLFLSRIGALMFLLNPDDTGKRLVFLIASFGLVLIIFVILDLLSVWFQNFPFFRLLWEFVFD